MLCQNAREAIITTQVLCGEHTIPRYKPKNNRPVYIKSFLAHQGSIIKKELFEIYGLYSYDLKVRMDYEFWMRVLSHTNFEYRSDVLVCFDPIGISNQNFSRYHSEEKIINQKYALSFDCWGWYLFRKSIKQISRLKSSFSNKYTQKL